MYCRRWPRNWPRNRFTPLSNVPQNVALLADQGMLRRAILNLVLNALDAMPRGGTLSVTGCMGSDHVELQVADSGTGLTEEAQQSCLRTVLTTKSHGTGLGLAIVYRIAEVHGGEVLAANCPEGGAAFTLLLPRPDVARHRSLERPQAAGSNTLNSERAA